MKNVIFEKAQEELDLYCFLGLYFSYIRVKDLGLGFWVLCLCSALLGTESLSLANLGLFLLLCALNIGLARPLPVHVLVLFLRLLLGSELVQPIVWRLEVPLVVWIT
jgi:hypothetical protein